MLSNVYFAVIAIFAIVLAAACYAVRRLESRPARLVSVIAALAVLVGSLVPVVRILSDSRAATAEVVAPRATDGTGPAPAAPEGR